MRITITSTFRKGEPIFRVLIRNGLETVLLHKKTLASVLELVTLYAEPPQKELSLTSKKKDRK